MLLSLETLKESAGILREVWFKDISIQDDPVLKYHPVFHQAADTLSVLQTFHVAPTFSTRYGQRLSTFIQVRHAGMQPLTVPLSTPPNVVRSPL